MEQVKPVHQQISELARDLAPLVAQRGRMLIRGRFVTDAQAQVLRDAAGDEVREARKRGIILDVGHAGVHFDLTVGRAAVPMHGKTSAIDHDGSGVFAGLPAPLTATRYHSLTLEPESLPDGLIVNATAEDGTIQGVRHATLPIHGVQFHPESIASEHGRALLRRFSATAAAAA